jgi:hypothetical protein
MRTMYLIDGVQVTKRIFERRQLFGEHKEARFVVIEVGQGSLERTTRRW